MYVKNLRLKWSCMNQNYLLKAARKGFAIRAWLAHDMARTRASTGVNQNFKEKSHGKIRGNTA